MGVLRSTGNIKTPRRNSMGPSLSRNNHPSPANVIGSVAASALTDAVPAVDVQDDARDEWCSRQ